MRWPLRYQILFPFAGVMLAVVVGVSLLDAFLAARRTQRQIEQQLNEVADTLAEGRFPLTDGVLRQARGLSGAEFVLMDELGQHKARSFEQLDPRSIPAAPAGKSFRMGQQVELAGTSYFHAAIGLPPRGAATTPMVLHIFYPRDSLREARWQAAYPPLLVGGLLLIVVAVLASVIARRLSRPLLELRQQLGQLVQGDFQPLALPRRNDELRDLVGSVNQLADQLEELHRVIKRSERLALMGQLSGGLAHQLRNAITGARLAIQLHGRRCRQLDQDSLSVALRQLSMTESHLERFLTAGRPAPPRRASCELNQVVVDVAALVAPTCQHRNVRLELPPAETEVTPLFADADQLRQVLLNLVLNAIEAAGSAGTVRIELAANERQATLRVLDSGPGIDANLLPRLFEPFATTKPEGIGLGLPVARQIVEAHGGSIRYLRTKETCFEITLPITAVPDAHALLRPEHRETSPSAEIAPVTT